MHIVRERGMREAIVWIMYNWNVMQYICDDVDRRKLDWFIDTLVLHLDTYYEPGTVFVEEMESIIVDIMDAEFNTTMDECIHMARLCVMAKEGTLDIERMRVQRHKAPCAALEYLMIEIDDAEKAVQECDIVMGMTKKMKHVALDDGWTLVNK